MKQIDVGMGKIAQDPDCQAALNARLKQERHNVLQDVKDMLSAFIDKYRRMCGPGPHVDGLGQAWGLVHEFQDPTAAKCDCLDAEPVEHEYKEPFLTTIRNWKHYWMGQPEKKYQERAIGIDANMVHDLARRLWDSQRGRAGDKAMFLAEHDENVRLHTQVEEVQAKLAATESECELLAPYRDSYYEIQGERDDLRAKLALAIEALEKLALPCTRRDFSRDDLDRVTMDIAKEALATVDGLSGTVNHRPGPDTPKLGITRDERKMLRELAAKSTRVQGWYAHSQYDGYHPGKASVRGPFGRWLLVEGGENKPGELGQGVADLYDDAKFAAAAMNNLPALLDALDRIDPPVQAEKECDCRNPLLLPGATRCVHGKQITGSGIGSAQAAKECPDCGTKDGRHERMNCPTGLREARAAKDRCTTCGGMEVHSPDCSQTKELCMCERDRMCLERCTCSCHKQQIAKDGKV
jgi:hypothetical protein